MHFAINFREFMVLVLGGLSASSVVFATLWVRARERAIRAESLLEGARIGVARSDTSGLALDAIAEEVERIGEGQRFLTRVMSEQASRASLPSRAPGTITPH